MRKISQRELSNQSHQILKQLEAGQHFLVTRDGVPIGELIPLRRKRGARLATILEIFRRAPRVEYKRLRKDLDALADPDPRPVAKF